METWKKVAIVGGVGLLAFSILPIWRSGRNGGQSLGEFVWHHSRFGKYEALWIKPEELKIIRALAEMKPEERSIVMARVAP